MIAAIALAAALSGPAKAVDRCQPLVPPALAAALAKAYPDHRLPRGTDQDRYNVDRNMKAGGSGCLGVAHGGFNGDRRRDSAVLLAAKDKAETLLVVALREGSAWRLELVETEDVVIGSKYVDIVAPGDHESQFWGQNPPEPNEVETIKSRTQGVATGMLESTMRFYFRVNGRWVFLWISD